MSEENKTRLDNFNKANKDIKIELQKVLNECFSKWLESKGF